MSIPLNRPLTATNNANNGTRNLRNIYQRQNRLARQRNTNTRMRRRRRVRLYTSNNNGDTLNRIMDLPQQQTTNCPLIDQFFNGTPFV